MSYQIDDLEAALSSCPGLLWIVAVEGEYISRGRDRVPRVLAQTVQPNAIPTVIKTQADLVRCKVHARGRLIGGETDRGDHPGSKNEVSKAMR